MPGPVICLDEADNVDAARTDIAAGTVIPGEDIKALNDVPVGHKQATRDIRKG